MLIERAPLDDTVRKIGVARLPVRPGSETTSTTRPAGSIAPLPGETGVGGVEFEARVTLARDQCRHGDDDDHGQPQTRTGHSATSTWMFTQVRRALPRLRRLPCAARRNIQNLGARSTQGYHHESAEQPEWTWGTEPPTGSGSKAGRANARFSSRRSPTGTTGELTELRELLRTSGVAAAGELVQRREQPHPNTYLGTGKLEEVKAELGRADANLVACDDELSPRQERNLEKALGVPVIDRTAIILDIFAAHAHSAEGKLQVELAQLEYNLARMRGLWSHLERLGGGIGTRGPGESQIETDRRLARDRISALKRRLARVRSSRSVMRAERERAHLPTIALAGYTNAGKSTLLNALTGATAGVGDRLFHTLDPTTRILRAGGRDYLLTDTVGFISKLPHQLVDAFGATLEETRLAGLILHVVDASAPEPELLGMVKAVQDVLAEIGADEAPQLLVLSKADRIDADRRAELEFRHPDAVLISAVTGEGLDGLVSRIEEEFTNRLRELELLIPFDEGARLAELHDIAGDLQRTDTPEGVRVLVRLPAGVAERYERFALGRSLAG